MQGLVEAKATHMYLYRIGGVHHGYLIVKHTAWHVWD